MKKCMQSAAAFTRFAPQVREQSALRQAITEAYRRPEPDAVAELLPQATLEPVLQDAIAETATGLVKALRAKGQ
ncbi:MAG: hypothetical protein WCY11_08850, partial [Novosphingobium sp.]